MRPHKKKKPLYVIDLETDPFETGRVPKVFAAGLWANDQFHSTWGKDCISEMYSLLSSLEPGIIYAHNGGRFDFYFFPHWITGGLTVINARIVKANIHAGHEIRDSFALLPFPLSAYKKTVIDYNIFEKQQRNKAKNKRLILDYLKDDCKDLWDLVSSFHEMFGDKLTIGSTSLKELKKHHSFVELNKMQDAVLRPYYFGGRVQCFEKGIIKGKLKVYDVNSMYPFVMANYKHPVGEPHTGIEVTKHTCFVTAEGKNYGAFPSRDEETGNLRFDKSEGVFSVSIHEWKTALDCNLFEPRRIIATVDFEYQTTFEEYVSKFYNLRLKAQADGDAIRKLFYKYVLNSSYGKFAQNPEHYKDYEMRPDTEWLPEPWLPVYIHQDYVLWEKPAQGRYYNNVATGASITGAARAYLMAGIHKAKRVVYCDTDSIICENLGADEDSKKLGAWKIEAEGTRIAIAGKKMYAFFQGKECIKIATKGVKLTPEEIVSVCRGKEVTWINQAPTFALKSDPKFLERDVRMTA